MADQHFRDVPKLTAPANASPGLIAAVDAVWQYAQTCVDLTGNGDPSTAPDFSDLLQADVGKDGKSMSDTSNASKMVAAYDSHSEQVKQVKTDLAGFDHYVGDHTGDTAGIADTTAGKIIKKITWLQGQLNVSLPKDDPRSLIALEGPMLTACANTVDEIHNDLKDANTQIQKKAAQIAAQSPPRVTTNSDGSRTFRTGSSTQNYAASSPQELSGVKATAQQIYDYLYQHYGPGTKMGLTSAQIAGILGNMQVESSFNTSAWNSGEGALGLSQWEGGRLSALRAFAASRHTVASDLNTQLDFLMSELNGNESGALAQLKAANSPEAAAAAFDQYYERSSGSSRGTRMADAQNIYNSIVRV
ncbi:phage tail tip lysozyme [Nocardia vaccinii]|uniref:phage tail tip lysozyme n=1 Tax=Nocardia vaccinii TaxID=1822 RepID=UPI00082E56D7|nr:phage tail tip lysozyme [Nocardia vaccinii]